MPSSTREKMSSPLNFENINIKENKKKVMNSKNLITSSNEFYPRMNYNCLDCDIQVERFLQAKETYPF